MAFLDKILQDSARYYDNINTLVTQKWYGERGIVAGCSTSNSINYISISTIGNALDFGDL